MPDLRRFPNSTLPEAFCQLAGLTRLAVTQCGLKSEEGAPGLPRQFSGLSNLVRGERQLLALSRPRHFGCKGLITNRKQPELSVALLCVPLTAGEPEPGGQRPGVGAPGADAAEHAARAGAVLQRAEHAAARPLPLSSGDDLTLSQPPAAGEWRLQGASWLGTAHH